MSSAEMSPQRSEQTQGQELRGVPANCLKLLLDIAITDPQDPQVQQSLSAGLNASVVTETTNPDGKSSVLLFCQAKNCVSQFTITDKYSRSSLILSGSVPGNECGLANKPK